MSQPTVDTSGVVRLVQWKPVPRDPAYSVSDDGRVRGMSGRDLTQRFFHADRRYLTVKLRGQDVNVHRLVAEAFIGPAGDQVVRHLNSDSLDNRAANLAYGTARENVQDAIRAGHHASVAAKAATSCRNGHEFSPENTARQNGWRLCRTCRRTRMTAAQRARRAERAAA